MQMTVAGGVMMAAVGAGLYLLAAIMLARANYDHRVPYWTSPRVRSGSSVAVRTIGAVAIGFAAIASPLGFWGLAALVVAILCGVAVIAHHNRSLAITRAR
ncbi:hypothetical protein R8Z57_16785 [Microbacterium sp. M3]|uniref:DUF3325 domain-containing protein n=1 Tax=Microbacterium arthrosphaerae TaxID=792652 RepID=A0ABU4H536_9MICO|nr:MULTISPECIES: hypothetical protein [Microbacterium]MDW4574436.1 hypothetical protein [Microbacterium arthrosphaerae]MDW7608291.1 hypothetical protein [Microbacterium sp. M3]